MHTYVLVKTHAPDAKEAKDIVEEYLMGSVGGDRLFDYVGDCEVITMTDKQKKEFEVETLEDMVAKYKAYTNNALETSKRRINEEVFLMMMKAYLPVKEAPLLVNDDDRRIKAAAEEILKAGGTKPLPNNLNELAAGVAGLLISGVSDFGCQLTYLLKSLATLLSALDYPEDYQEACESPDNHYIDYTLEEEQDKDQPVFYVIADRHY